MKVDFFIIGASKCGTTALSQYLSEHRNICFAKLKEPHFFSDDFPKQRMDKNLAAYWTNNFSHYNRGNHGAVGEGSGTYYVSKVAIANILKYNPKAKFIYMVRNPVEMLRSWHDHVQFGTGENIPLKEAWQGKPQYRELCALGRRLDAISKLVPARQLMVIVFDDFVTDTKKVYQDVLQFIGVPFDGRTHFPKVNEAKAQRSRLLGRIDQAVPKWARKIAPHIKRLLKLPIGTPLNPLVVLNTKPIVRRPLSESTRIFLSNELEGETLIIEKYLNRDLRNWRH
jgi:hypothetical protein